MLQTYWRATRSITDQQRIHFTIRSEAVSAKDPFQSFMFYCPIQNISDAIFICIDGYFGKFLHKN